MPYGGECCIKGTIAEADPMDPGTQVFVFSLSPHSRIVKAGF